MSHFSVMNIQSYLVFWCLLIAAFVEANKGIDYDSNLFTFIQISDTHISSKSSYMTNVNFRLFTSTVLPGFNPEFVIHTGDITDGWKSTLVSGELEEEWIMYKSSLQASNYHNSSIWFDVRGNHDNSNLNSSRNHYYYQYSPCGQEEHVYNRIIQKSFGKYCFIGVDATLSPSPGCLLTYFGYVSSHDRAKMKEFLKIDNQQCNHTTVFMHYPTLYANSPALHSLYRQSPPSFVLAGHVHSTLGERANTRLNENTIELVIKDFKKKHLFRVFCFDNDYLSYTDVNLDDSLHYPILMITNPPNSQLVSIRQNLRFLELTKFIHIFVYDISHNNDINLDGFSLSIDSVQLPSNVTNSSTIPHLFYISWNPYDYGIGLHTITVIYDNHHHSSIIIQSFMTSYQTLNDVMMINNTLPYLTVYSSLNPGDFTGTILLKSTFVPILITLSYTGSLLLIIIILIARMTIVRAFPYPIQSTLLGRIRVRRFLERQNDMHIPTVVKSILVMASDKYIAYFFIGAVLWMIFGIWSIGVFPDEFGIQTLWGMLFIPKTFNGSYSLWLDLYVWAITYLAGFFVPLAIYYCVIMSPSPLLRSGKPMYRWLYGIGQIISFAYFLGVFFFLKLKLLIGSMNFWTLALSPIHIGVHIVNLMLMIREIMYSMDYRTGEKSKECYEVFETVYVHDQQL